MKILGSCAIALASMFAAMANAQETPEIDHILWAVPDLEKGATDAEALLGVKPVYGGFHPGSGTANYLLSLGDIYFEIYGPNPDLETPEGNGAIVAAQHAPGLWEFAMRASDLEGLVEAGRSIGLESSGPREGSRATPSGGLLAWRAMSFSGHEFGRLIPFYIDWKTDVHPADTSPQAGKMTSLIAVHPNAERLREIYEALEIPVAVVRGAEAALVAEFETPNGPLWLVSKDLDS